MPKNNKIKILCLLIIGIVFLYIYGPIAFMKDGLVTRQSVNSFDELYNLGSSRGFIIFHGIQKVLYC